MYRVQVLTSSTSLPLQQNEAASLKGISSACPIGIDEEACQMNGLFVPFSSAYDVSSGGRSESSNMLGVEIDGHDDTHMGVSVDTIEALMLGRLLTCLQTYKNEILLVRLTLLFMLDKDGYRETATS
nr:beta-amylase 7 [Tanacetum cinerariifolium]